MNAQHTPVNVAAPNQKARGFILNSTPKIDPLVPANLDGFTETKFAEPYPVTLFPASSDYHSTTGLAIGVEKCNRWGGERLIVRYDSQPVRKSNGVAESWPGGVLYCASRDVSGWKEGAQ